MFKLQSTILLFLSIVLISCDQFTNNNNTSKTSVLIEDNKSDNSISDNEYAINGTVFNAENETIYLFKREENTLKIKDSTTINKNSFYFKGSVENPEIYAISKYKNKGRFHFLVDNSLIQVFINPRIEKSSSYSSSKLQQEYLRHTNKILEFKDQGMQLYYGMRGDFSNKNIKELKKKRLALFAKQGEFENSFIKEHPDSYYTAMIINNRLKTHGYKANKPLFDGLSDNLKTSELGKSINAFLIEKAEEESKKIVDVKVTPKSTSTNSQTTASGEYRPKAYTISGKNPYGENLSLNSIPKGKVVLVDFWASWCGPCRATNPSLVALYNKYHNQGFEIMSVSEDKGEAEWITAINVDNLTWDYHVIDKNKTIAFRYGVEAIPFNVLIDKQGRIASEKISGPRLESKIIQLLRE